MDIFLDWKWGLPQAKFLALWLASLHFGEGTSTWTLVVAVSMELWKIIGTAVSLGTAGPTKFSPGTRVPSCKHPAQKFCRGEVQPYL
jgi:hypothetical protein